MQMPTVTSDPRFRAACKLVKTGKAHCGAIDIFAALVEDTRSQFGETSLNSAASYYEYGHALFRAACRREDEKDMEEDDLDKKPIAEEKPKIEKGEKMDIGKTSQTKDVLEIPQQQEEDDVVLALELMENSWAILDEYVQSVSNSDEQSLSDVTNSAKKNAANTLYLDWAKDQLPRILLGIGDLFSFQNKYADAVDAYTRAIPHREQFIPDKNSKVSNPSKELLKRRRQLVEVFVLVAETLLKCPDGEDLVTSESQALLVKDSERIDFARGYYDKAKDELQETVFLMGKLATQDLGTEKEDICFLATMLMGVGTTLASYEEDDDDTKGSTTKKLKIK